MEKRMIIALIVCLMGFSPLVTIAGSANPYKILKASDFPYWWGNYQGWTDNYSGNFDPKKDPFSNKLYKRILNDGTPAEYLEVIRRMNPSEEVEYSLENGAKLISGGEDLYYYTVDRKGRLVSLFVAGEDDGVFLLSYPDERAEYEGDDLLCFFRGKLKKHCAIADDS
jgi:hypothetical protein